MEALSLTVSLTDVVDAIASRISIPADHLAAIEAAAASPARNPRASSSILSQLLSGDHLAAIEAAATSPARNPRASSSILSQLLSGHLRSLYRLDYAAAALQFLLIEEATSPDHMPAWRHRGPTGLPIKLHTEDQKNRALAFLERKSLEAKQSFDEYLTGRLKNQFFEPLETVMRSKPEDEDEWGKHLEFARSEIIRFMNLKGIPHSLEEKQAEDPSALVGEAVGAGKQLPYLPSNEIAKVFDKRPWAVEQWANKLKAPNATPWLLEARRSKGHRGGVAATWDPVVIAKALHGGEVRKRVGGSMRKNVSHLKI
jgi:hypothetical protein